MQSAPGTNPMQQQQQVISKEYYVKVPKTKKRYHALKFHTANVDLANMNKAEMVRDVVPQAQRQEWETLPKSGAGSEYGREAREMYRRKKFGFMAKKKNVDDMPWILSNKANDKHYIGKKSVSENSSYFVFIKCADGGFEACPLEDWYSFAPHKTYKTLNHDEAEEQFKIRHKTLNKYYIMVNKRKTDGNEEEEEEDQKGSGLSKSGISSFGMNSKSSKDSWVSDGEDDTKRSKKKSDYKSSNLSDDDDEEEENFDSRAKNSKKKKESDDEMIAKEDSDDGDREGIEMDYSSSDSEQSEPEKLEEKYQQIGIDEEEAIKVQNKSDESESEEDEDAGLTEAGKEYRKLIKKGDDKDSDEFDEIFKGKSKDDDDSSSSFDDSDFESETAKQRKSKQALAAENKLKRKASDELVKKQPDTKKQIINQDESSSSSSTANITSKSTKTAAIIAAAAAANSKQAGNNKTQSSSTATKSSTMADKSDSSSLTEDEVRRYLSRKPMTSKELLHKFRGKTQSAQNKMSNQQLVESLRIILDKLKAKMIEQNGVKYLTLP